MAAEVRVLDLSSLDAIEFQPQSGKSLTDATSAELPFNRVDPLGAVGDFQIFEEESVSKDMKVVFEVPPPVDEDALEFHEIDTPLREEFPVSLTKSVHEIETDCLSLLGADGCIDTVECDAATGVCYGDMPFLLTHQALGFGHRCVRPIGNRWIFWRDECSSRGFGPICCTLQEHLVNWRLSSMNLKGCMPEGYSLQCFIESTPNVEFHQTPLAINGPVDPGGNLAQARTIEGEEVKSIAQISINIAPTQGELPVNHASQKFAEAPTLVHLPGVHRDWSGTSFYWNASLLNHQPLYFEDANLERHGFSHGCWQPFYSGTRFLGQLAILPYNMGAKPPQETEFTLGETRPGSHACYVCKRPPLRLQGAAWEAASVIGLVFLIP